MKKSILALAIGTAVSCGAQADILISEYVEGSGYNKAIEIANTGDQAETLTGYAIHTALNGTPFAEKATLDHITIQPSDVYVIVNKDSRISAELKALGDEESPNAYGFNGDDAVALFKDGALIDVIGVEADRSIDLKDNTFVRFGATANTTFTPSEWNQKNKDDFTGLGQHDATALPPKPEPAELANIWELQGDSWSSPYTDPANKKYTSDETFIVEGVVTAIQTTELKYGLPVGFFIQDENGDGNPKTSDGIFVKGTPTGLTVGDKIAVTGKVTEDYGWTVIESTAIEAKGTGTVTPVAVTTLEDDVDFDFTLERHEGMLVKFDKESDMRVSRNFGFSGSPFYRNNMVVSNGQVNVHPNQNNAPAVHDDKIDTDAEHQTDCNEDKRIVVESFGIAPKGVIPWYPDFGLANAVPMPDGTTTAEDYIRIGDVIDGFEGVIGYSGIYSYNDYRLFVTNTITKDNFIREDSKRTQTPVLKEGGNLRIATFNVLNYFNSPFGGDNNPNNDNRGATTEPEFQLQGDKIAKAIVAMNADIIGLMEIENNGFGESSAVAHLVNKINALIDDKADHYSYVVGNKDDKFIGSDVIANQVIFKASKVSLDTYRLIKMPEQHAPEVAYIDTKDKNKTESGNNYQRDTLAPSFKINGTEEKITVAVNHLKSKGSTCWEDVQTGKQLDSDKQGSCENFRVSAAFHLGQELSKIDGYKLILGDLNSYGNEDPIMVLTNRDKAPEDHVIKAARNTSIGGENGIPLHGDDGAVITDSYGYVNIVRQLHPDSYSYSYNDEIGTLDYILVTPELMNKVVDATDWNINAGESTLFQYSDEYNCVNGKCSTRFSDLYRASDHDPAVIDLKLGSSVNPEPPVVIPTPTAPKNPPADLPEVPEAPVAGEPIQVMFDLTNIDGTPLHAGDKAVLNIAKINRSKAAFAGADTNSVALTQEIIKQGWVELEGDVSDAGEFQMTKQIIDGRTGQLVYTSPAETIKVAEKGDDKTKPVDPNPGHDHGGSTGLFGLLSLLGLGFFRRKMSK